MELVMNYFAQFGIITLFVIIFLEHINTPGLPAGVIMPAIGVLISQHKVSFLSAIFITLLAGVLGSLLMYIIGYYGGAKLLDKIEKKYPTSKKHIDKAKRMVSSKKCYAGVACRFLPVIRTLIAIIEGGLKVNFVKFMVTTVIGVGLFNIVYIGGGYFFGYYFI